MFLGSEVFPKNSINRNSIKRQRIDERSTYKFELVIHNGNMQSKNTSGQSLVIVVVAGALIAAIGMGVSRFISSGLKGQKTVQANYEITTLKDDIRNLLTDPTACKNTFQDLVPWPVSNAPLTVTNLKSKINATRFSVGQKYRDNAIIFESAKLGAFSQDPATSLEGYATLNLEFKKVGESFGSSTVTKTLQLNVTVLSAADPKITSCSVSSDGGGEGAEKKWVLAAMDDMSGGNQCFETTGTCDGTYYVQAASHTRWTCVGVATGNNTGGTTPNSPATPVTYTSMTGCGPESTIAGAPVYTNNYYQATNSGTGHVGALGQSATGGGVAAVGLVITGKSATVKVCCKKPPTL